MNSGKNETLVTICLGAGGVGKTTVASVLGLDFALAGYKTLVITVDPAKRLLDALSIEKYQSIPTKVDMAFLSNKDFPNSGELYAFMPDLKKEWMDFLRSSINHQRLRHEISSNPFYQYMSEGLPGSLEIICSHILFRLMEKGKYDQIVLDTPPSSHSISFFDTPKKISDLLSQGFFRAFLSKRNSIFLKITKKLAAFSQSFIENTLERLIGSHFLSELIDFALTIDALYEPMLARTQAMEKLLTSKNTHYVLVTRPTVASVSDCFSLRDSLKKRGIAIKQVVLNQILPELNEHELIKEEKSLNHNNPEYLETIKYMVSLYQKQILLERNLKYTIFKEFTGLDKRFLFLSDPTLSKTMLVQRLLDQYQGI